MENFDLRISDHDGSTLRMAVTHSQAGDVAPVEVAAPAWTALDLVDDNDAHLRAMAADFTAQMLPESIWQAWRESWAAAGEAGIRLRIRCADTNSVRIPWELLYDAQRRYFLARDPRSPLVRYLEGLIPDTAKPIEGPLRMLLTSASPADRQELAVGKELDGIASILVAAKQAGRIEVTRLDDLTPDGLDRALLEVKPHVFHFSGHAQWEEAEDAGYLLLDDGSGQSAILTDTMLAMLLRNRGVALVVLNACETAQGGEAWAGLAPSLVLAGVPAIVAMQMPVADRAAAAFTGTLYTALANGYSLEQAVTVARQTTARQPEDVARPGEWLAPALFMRTGSERFWLHEEAQQAGAPADGVPDTRIDIDAVNVALGNQIIDQRGAEITVGEKKIDTGGGAYVGGNVSVGGDFVGRDKIVHQGGDSGQNVSKAFSQLAASVALQASAADVDRAVKLVSAMQQAFVEGDDDRVADCIGDLGDLVPAVKEALTQAFSHPPLNERLGPAAKYALRRLG